MLEPARGGNLNPSPNVLQGAHVLLYSFLDERHTATGATEHLVNGKPLEGIAGLAICRYEDDEGFYLFYCAPDWEVLTDTFHETLHGAQDQAEVDFEGVSATWTPPESEP